VRDSRLQEKAKAASPARLPHLARISHTFFQNKREAADFLSFPYFGEKQSVCGAC
jgi:hypothetical protein